MRSCEEVLIMSEWRRKFYIVCITILVSACSTSTRQNEFSRHIEYPLDTQTRATNYLACFGDMLTTYRTSGNSVSPLKLAVVDVKDATNVSSSTYPDSEIPNNFTDMTLGLVSRIGGPIRVSHIPNSNEILDAARYKSINDQAPYLGHFKPSHYNWATIQLYGALTEYDRVIRNTNKGAEGAFEFGSGSGETNLEASVSSIKNVARMTMDFRIVSAHVGDVVNNSGSTNTVQVYQLGNDLSFGLSVDGQSIGFSKENSVVDARHKAIRLLIEWGIMEALGRYAYVPYWKCLPNSDNKQQIGFKDIVADSSLYNFATLNRNKNYKRARPNSNLVDMRDKMLMNAVLSDFHNAEYVDNGTRKLLKRPEKNTTLVQRNKVDQAVPTKTEVNGKTVTVNKKVSKIVESKSVIDGKATLRKDLLQLYRQDRRYAKLSDSALLKRLHSEFVKAKVISPRDEMFSANTYLALWLNVPVKKGARWRR